MSIMQRLTLIGMYNYNPTLFDNLTLPAGYDKDTFIETLLLEHGEKCVLYPEPEFMKYSLGVVSRKWKLELERIYEALNAEYNPIWNYDRYEDIEDHNGKKWGEKTEADYNEDRTANLSDTSEQLTNGFTEQKTNGFTEQTKSGYSEQKSNGFTEQKTDGYDKQVTNASSEQITDGHTKQGSAKGTTERQVAAFNSSTYENSEKTITDVGQVDTSQGKIETSMGQIDHSVGKVENSQGKIETDQGKIESSQGKIENSLGKIENSDGKTKVDHTGTDKVNTKGTLADKNGNETENLKHDGHMWGNIGVTTAAQMVTEVVEQRIKFNLYGTAAQIFASELLINIY